MISVIYNDEEKNISACVHAYQRKMKGEIYHIQIKNIWSLYYNVGWRWWKKMVAAVGFEPAPSKWLVP